jgi:hypothetical protein
VAGLLPRLNIAGSGSKIKSAGASGYVMIAAPREKAPG